MYSWASQIVGAVGETRFAKRLPIRFGATPPEASWPLPMARRSCDGEDFLELRWNVLPVIYAVGGNAQSQSPDR